MISINYRSALPLYEQVKESFIRLIMTGALKPDEQLPSVRELAVELAINPNTIQRAYREMESEGYIYTVSGRGCFVAKQEEARANTAQLLESFKDAAAKLIFNGVEAEQLKKELEKINREVGNND
ncbi:MAG: GntR family transcriptional regulator [Eubacterium sp.]|nr:GntR family transcriptional regulator [Eubacterium sp.]MBR7073132.1 GntR family transcriptional regulator [Eubacterium sp.]